MDVLQFLEPSGTLLAGSLDSFVKIDRHDSMGWTAGNEVEHSMSNQAALRQCNLALCSGEQPDGVRG